MQRPVLAVTMTKVLPLLAFVSGCVRARTVWPARWRRSRVRNARRIVVPRADERAIFMTCRDPSPMAMRRRGGLPRITSDCGSLSRSHIVQHRHGLVEGGACSLDHEPDGLDSPPFIGKLADLRDPVVAEGSADALHPVFADRPPRPQPLRPEPNDEHDREEDRH